MWGEEIQCSSKEQAAEFLSSDWSNGDELYVLQQTQNFVGCVAVDRKNCFPFVSHLFVETNQRQKGYAKAMLMFVGKVASLHGFHDVSLWCKPELQAFYEKLAWQQEGRQNGLVIMKKIINDPWNYKG